jgi:uncharacterized protein (UPF0332 family)
LGKGIKNPEFQECVKRKKIREFSEGKNLYEKELSTAQCDYQEAEDSIKNGKYKWATIQAYYAMFHCARSLLYKQNYREKSHYCLIVALKALYVDTGALPVYFPEKLQRAKNLRENADYYDDWTELSAKQMLADTAEFLKRARELLTS